MIKTIMGILCLLLAFSANASFADFDGRGWREQDGRRDRGQCEGQYSIVSGRFSGVLQLGRRNGFVQFNGYPKEQVVDLTCNRRGVSFTRLLVGGGTQHFSGRMDFSGEVRVLQGSWSGVGGHGGFTATEDRRGETRGCLGSYSIHSGPYRGILELNRRSSFVHFDGFHPDQIVNIQCRHNQVSFQRVINGVGTQFFQGHLSGGMNRRVISGSWNGVGGGASFTAYEN